MTGRVEVECSHDPRSRRGLPIGMYHCPECGCMVIAGLPHTEHDPEACYLVVGEPS